MQKAPRKSRRLQYGLIIVAISWLLAAFGPVLGPYDPMVAGLDISQAPPALTDLPNLLILSITGANAAPPHWLGTDRSGLDIFARVIAAPRTDMLIAIPATVLSCALGTLLGLLAGYTRIWATELMMRVSDGVQAFPAFITAMMLVALGGRSTSNIVVALVLVYTPLFARLTYAEVLVQVSRSYVEAARAAGNRGCVIALRHVLPNAMAPALVQCPATLGFAIILTAGISFVGAGVRPPTPEWGLMISQGAPQLILGEWWPSVFPGVTMMIVVLGYAMLGRELEMRLR